MSQKPPGINQVPSAKSTSGNPGKKVRYMSWKVVQKLLVFPYASFLLIWVLKVGANHSAGI